MAALHPERVSGLVSGGMGYNIQKSTEVLKPVAPDIEQRHWYWFCLSFQRGAEALQQDRAGYCRYLCSTFPPTRSFDDETYAHTAASFDNPDFVAVVLHAYRCRVGAAAGDPVLNERLAAGFGALVRALWSGAAYDIAHDLQELC